MIWEGQIVHRIDSATVQRMHVVVVARDRVEAQAMLVDKFPDAIELHLVRDELSRPGTAPFVFQGVRQSFPEQYHNLWASQIAAGVYEKVVNPSRRTAFD